MNVIKIRVESFEAYGLNKYRNFISPETQLPYYDDPEDLIELCCEIIEESECDNCAIFIHCIDDDMYAVVNGEVYEGTNGNMEFFSEVDSAFRLCCYSLIMETHSGHWEIIGG